MYVFYLFQLLDKKPPKNEKFQNIKKTIDTGKTIKDVQILSDSFVTKRRSELFKRIKGSTIVKLIDENHISESIYNLAEEDKEESIYGLSTNNKVSGLENQSVKSYRTEKTEMTMRTNVTAVTYATDMLGDIVFIYLNLV